MSRGLLFSFIFHAFIIYLTALTLPFMLREPIDLPPIVSVELIEIKDKTNIPFAPKAREIIEKVKEGGEKSCFRTSTSSCKSKRKTRQNTNA